ncbi:MAG: hypothetical protein DRH90_16705 [Deltaproteobacteria bacterium]|nr:MAG: hypothetical protein DRH90_16705 [Deltaproteobacteria bacterium]RLC18219.1 MAG: hypothetical protein DRI24_03760 [Deltaproteobacteria bacterium]
MNSQDLNLAIGNQAGKHLGDLVGWSMRDLKVSCLEAKQLAKNYGLEEDFVFPNLNTTSAYRRAVRKATCKGAHDNRRHTAVRLVDDEKHVGHAIVRSDVIDLSQVTQGAGGELIAKEAQFQTDVKIGLKKQETWVSSPSELLVTTNLNNEVVQEITKRYLELVGVYTFDDIRSAFQNAFKEWAGMRILSHGGLWFVLSDFSGKIQSWKSFMKEIGCDPLVIPVFETEEVASSFKKIAKDSLTNQLGELKLEIKGFAKNTRKSTLEKRLDDFSSLKIKTQLYKKALGVQADSIENLLSDTEKELTDLILEKGKEC